MMKYALFLGCKIPYFLKGYGKQTRAVLDALGIQTKELGFGCCGYPNRELHFESFVLSSARNLALAEQKKLNIVTPCKCCFGAMKHAIDYLRNNDVLRAFIDEQLALEGLSYSGELGVYHLLSVLGEESVLQKIRQAVVSPQKDLKVAAHYGCHALRPSEITNFDNPFSPTIFEKVVEATGAETVDWPRRLDCCGRPIWDRNQELSRSMMQSKLRDAVDSGADYVCTACTYCQIQFEDSALPRENAPSRSREPHLPQSILITELLAKSMGLRGKIWDRKYFQYFK